MGASVGQVGDGLWNAIIENAKVFFLEARDNVAALGGGNHIEGDDGDVNGDGHARLRGLRCVRRGFAKWGSAAVAEEEERRLEDRWGLGNTEFSASGSTRQVANAASKLRKMAFMMHSSVAIDKC